MRISLINIVIFESAFLIILAIGESLYRVFRIHPEITRKFSHVSLSLVVLLLPSFTRSILDVTILGVMGVIVIFAGIRFRLLRSINSVGRNSAGTVTFIASLFICYVSAVLLDNLSLFYIPILILALADSAAGLTGMFLPVKKWPASTWAGQAHKTYAGSAVFFLVSFPIVLLVLPNFHPSSTIGLLLTCFIIGITGALVEAFSGKGYDNLTVPMSVLLILILAQYI